MSASESSPLSANLQETLGQLIAEAVRQSQMDQQGDQDKLKVAMAAALEEIESSQAALNRAAKTLQDALNVSPEVTNANSATANSGVEETATPIKEEVVEVPVASTESPAANPHELDIIAHRVDIDTAMNLQSMLRSRPEVTSAQTREFANGELRLHLQMESGLDMPAFTEWVEGRNGKFGTKTDSVIELDFGH